MRESTLFTLSVAEGPALSPADGSAIEARGDCASGGAVGPTKELCRSRSAVIPELWTLNCQPSTVVNCGPGMSPPATPLECVVTKNAPVSALESVVAKTKDLNSPGINTYKKHWGWGVGEGGGGYPLLASLLAMSLSACLLSTTRSLVSFGANPGRGCAAPIIRFSQPGKGKNNRQQHREFFPMPPRAWPKSAWAARLSGSVYV